MAASLPVQFQELLNLPQLQQQGPFNFNNVTLESDKFVCVKTPTQINIITVDTKKSTSLNVPNADSAIMNPVSNILALRAAGKNLQIFNLDSKSKVNATQTADPVQYWRWLDASTIAIVTTKAVYHWINCTTQGNTTPTKMFTRASDGRQVQIINYDTSSDRKWLLLQGITRNAAGNGVDGVLQLFSVDLKKFQPTMNAHGGCFAQTALDSTNGQVCNLFCFANFANQAQPTISFIQVDGTKQHKVSAALKSQPGDFPVSCVPDNKHSILFVLTTKGYLMMFDMNTGKELLNKQISQQTFFVSTSHKKTGGVAACDKTGRVVQLNVDEKNIVQYAAQTLGDRALAQSLSMRCGAQDEIARRRFNQHIASGQYAQAAKLAATAGDGILRTVETVARLQQLQSQGTPVDLQYFQAILSTGTLNEFEAVACCKRILSMNAETGKLHIKKWIESKKLAFSEELGDVLLNFDLQLACSVYIRATASEKAILCFCQLGMYDKVTQYAQSVNYTPNYTELLRKLHGRQPTAAQSNPRDDAKTFASNLVTSNSVQVNDVVAIFMGSVPPDVENTTSFLLDYLKARGDRPEDADLQFKLLAVNLQYHPQVADAIMESDEYTFTQYDKMKIARMCEQANLFQRALDHYEDLENIKRVLQMGLGMNSLTPKYLIGFFGNLQPDDALSCLRDLLQYQGSGQNLQLVVEIAKVYSDQLLPEKLIALFEEFNSWEGLFFYLSNVVSFTKDPEVVFKYIQAAAEIAEASPDPNVKQQRIRQIEQVCRENTVYDPEQVKKYLLQGNKVKDPRPLIHVCDLHGFQEELTRYLYTNQKMKFIEVYVKKMNQAATPNVCGALLDLNAPDDKIRDLVNAVRPPGCPIQGLVEAFEKRSRLRLLLDWLENRQQEGLTDTALHNALAKLYIERNINNPQHFLMSNQYYDPKEVGKYCETMHPEFAFIAYKRANGDCDTELVDVTSKHGFFKHQARYVVERMDDELWTYVLREENENRRELIDQVVSTALPDSRKTEEIIAAVKAFKNADLPNELIELLERIVLNSSDRFIGQNQTLQNLLMLTAFKADPERALGYIDRLDNYAGPDIAEMAISQEYQLYEIGFQIYKKFECGMEAMQVLVKHFPDDVTRIADFADQLNTPEVWSILANTQLRAKDIKGAIESFIKADDAQFFKEVINEANSQQCFGDLIQYLLMSRTKVRDKEVDNWLVIAYARTDELVKLQEFIELPNHSNLDEVGDKLKGDGLFTAASYLFKQINNFSKLAECYVELTEWQEGYEAARKASNMETWNVVCRACVSAKEFRLASMCGVNIIINPIYLKQLIEHYEELGFFEEVIQLLEQGVNMERAHQGIYTELGILYAQFKESKLMEHIKLFYARLNIPSLIQVCKDNLHWNEAVFLYTNYGMFDNAVELMRDHPSCFKHELFKSVVTKVSNSEEYYRCVDFYLREHPKQADELMCEVSAKLNPQRALRRIENNFGQQYFSLIKGYLLKAQREDIMVVNEAINQYYIEEEDFEKLRTSLQTYENFQAIPLAKKLETHEMVEFRKIALWIYKHEGRHKKAIEIAKGEGLWDEAMNAAAESRNNELAESLLRFFLADDSVPKCAFPACLYTCYEMIRPDVVLELSWRHGLTEFSMPYMVQTFRTYEDRITALETKNQQREKQEREAEEAEKKENAKNEAKAAQEFAGQPTLMLTNSPAPSYGGGMQPMSGGGANMYAPNMGANANPMGSAPMGANSSGFGQAPSGFGQTPSGFGNQMQGFS